MNERSFTTPSDQAGTDEQTTPHDSAFIIASTLLPCYQETLSSVSLISVSFSCFDLPFDSVCELHGDKQ
jgi:hypothetical protein